MKGKIAFIPADREAMVSRVNCFSLPNISVNKMFHVKHRSRAVFRVKH
jgi:hypothetical protein